MPRRAEPRRGGVALVACLVVAVSLLAGSEEPAAATAARRHEVVIQGLLYLPGTLKVKRGDAVVWTNKDAFPHTVTAPGAFDSRSIEAGQSWRSVARRAGTYRYVCTLHSNMAGVLEVE